MTGAPTASLMTEVTLGDGSILSAAPFYIVTYVEAAPDKAAAALATLLQQVTDSRGEPGMLRMEVLQCTGRQNHFVMLEAWADHGARAAHAGAAHTVAFRAALEQLLYSPYEERAYVALNAGDPSVLLPASADTVFVVTHLDIIPNEMFAPCVRQVDENGPCGHALVQALAAASRKHKGNLCFDVLTQASRPNHMTIVEVWDSAASHEAHMLHADTRGFRDGLVGIVPGSGVQPDPQFLPNPLPGALYDERVYTIAHR